MPQSRGSLPTCISLSASLQAFGSLLLLFYAIGEKFSSVSIVHLLLAAVGMLTAYENIRLKKWARYSTLAFSTLLVLLPIGIILAFVYLEHARNPDNQADTDLVLYLVSIGFVLLLISLGLAALGGFWLYYFNRFPIRQLFANGGEDRQLLG